MLDSKKHTRKQTRERLLCDGKKWRQTDCRQSHQKPSKHGWDSNVILRVKTGGSMMAKHCKVHVLRTGPLSCSWAQIFLIWLSSTDLYVSVDSFWLSYSRRCWRQTYTSEANAAIFPPRLNIEERRSADSYLMSRCLPGKFTPVKWKLKPEKTAKYLRSLDK